MELMGLFPPLWWTLGSGHLVPTLGCRVWIYLLFLSFIFYFFPVGKKGGFFLSLSFSFLFFLIFLLFFEWSWLLCRNSLLLPASV